MANESIDFELSTIKNNIYGHEIRMAIHDALKKLSTSIQLTPVPISETEYNNLPDSAKTDTTKIYFVHDDDNATAAIGIAYGGIIFSSGGGSTAVMAISQPVYGFLSEVS